jgi:ABC-type glycerol-3-phosphate transport system permease component
LRVDVVGDGRGVLLLGGGSRPPPPERNAEMPLIPKVGRNTRRARFVLGAITVVLWLGVLLHLFPFWWMVAASLKPTREIFERPFDLWPRDPSLASYNLLFSTISAKGMNLTLDVFRYPMWVYFWNSILIAAGTVLIQIPVTAAAAYAITKLHAPRWAKLLFLFGIGTLMIPSEIATVPRFLLLSHFPWPTRDIPHAPFTGAELPSVSFVGSYWGVILPAGFSAFNLLLFKGFFDTIPNDLIDAARIDGASEMAVFRRIMLPLAQPILAVTAYFAFTGAWNSFLTPWIILMSEQGKWPLSVVLYKLQFFLTSWQPSQGSMDPAAQKLLASGVGYNALMALSVVESIPIFIAFLIFREHLMKGIRLSGFR